MTDMKGHRRRAMSPLLGGKLAFDRPIIKPKPRVGIKRMANRTRIAQDLPITDRHEAILRMVDIEDPMSAQEIADVLQLGRAGVNSSLYALQDRGLVQRVPYKGWIKIPQP